MSETGDPHFDAMGALADHNLDELIKAREALAASAARIEAQRALLQRFLDFARMTQAFVYPLGALQELEAALDAAPRSDAGRDFIAELEAKEPTQALRDLMSARGSEGAPPGMVCIGKVIDEDSYGLIAHFGNGLPPAGTKLYAPLARTIDDEVK